jgi:hypothetical protein
MELEGVTFVGPPIDDEAVLAAVPPELRDLLERANGLVAYGGGLHIRGACREPEWHSLRETWLGAQALHRRYGALTAADVPFAQDALGDFLLALELDGSTSMRSSPATGWSRGRGFGSTSATNPRSGPPWL